MIRASLCGLGLLALMGCDPVHLSGEANPNSNRNAGALGGAALGAVTGAIVGDSASTTAISAAAGGIIGAGIGSILDRQAADLRQDLGNDAVTVTNQGDSLLVNFPQDILFASDSAALSPSSRDELMGLAKNLNSYPDTVVEVIGHTDNTGAASHNFDLSNRRAGAVSAVLVEGGVAGPRIQAMGRGEDQPVASNLTEEGKAQNRRVEVIIRPVVAAS